MPPRIELEHQRDFTGGLNLATEIYDLQPNESPSVQNVDIDRRGGFAIRRGSKAWITTSTGYTDVDTIYTYVTPGGTRQLLACKDRQVKRWDGSAWQAVAAAFGGGRTMFAEMNNILYMAHGLKPGVGKWDGTTFTTLANPGYNDNLAAPAGGKAPPAATLAVHNGVMWAGNVYDTIDAAHHVSRLRWSHPGKPEDWRTNDWIDLDPDDETGEIRALVPFGDRLIVFKDRAVYAVHGFPPEGFSVVNISKEVGAPSQYAVCKSENRIWFWDTSIGLCEFDGQRITWPFERIFPLIEDNLINVPFSFQTIAVYHNRRVWLSVPYLAAPYANTFVGLVFGPDIGKNGAWTLHTKTLFSFHVHEAVTGGDRHLLGGNGAYVYEMDAENYYLDQKPPSHTTSKISAWYQTRWFDNANPALKKRWKRPIIVVGRDANEEFLVDVFSDYDATHVKKTFSLFTDVNGTEGVWDVSNWDAVIWAAELGDSSVIKRGSPLGTGTAKMLRISNVTSGVDWRVQGITMKWVPKRIRN